MTQASILEHISRELGPLRETAKQIEEEGWKGGSWFVGFVQNSLRAYADDLVRAGGADALRKRWPDKSNEVIADRLVAQAIRQTTLAGVASGATASAAYAATLAPASLVAALPAALSTVGAEILYTTRAQIRLVYDLATLYGYPLDLADPEDLYKAFALAYGVPVSVEEVDRDDVSLDALRAHIRALTSKQGKTQRDLFLRVVGPQIGRQIALRALARVGVPVVGIGASALLNYWATRDMALIARHEIRTLARLREVALPLGKLLQGREDAMPIVVEALMLQATADGHFGPHEREIYDAVVNALGVPDEMLERAERELQLDVDAVVDRVGQLEDGIREPFARCLELLAVGDGWLGDEELAVTGKLMRALGHPPDVEAMRARAAEFQPPKTTTARATRFLKARAQIVAERAGETGKEVADRLGESGRVAAKRWGTAAGTVAGRVGDVSEQAGDVTVGWFRRGARTTGRAMGAAWERTGRFAATAADSVGEKAGAAWHGIGHAWDRMVHGDDDTHIPVQRG